MEKKDKKKIIIGVLAGIIVVLAGLCVYLLFIKKDNSIVDNNCPKCEECPKQEEAKEECNCPKCENVTNDVAKSFYQNMVKNRKVSTEYDYGIEIVMDKNGNVYYSGVDNNKAVGTKGKYEIEGYIAGISDDIHESQTFEEYKLPVSNVVNYYYNPIGNGGMLDYIFIKADGTIAKLSYFIINGKAQIESFTETVAGYKNIVGIIPSNGFGAHSYKLFDIYGNVYN